MRSCLSSILVLATTTLVSATGIRAELIYFKSGGRLQAPATVGKGLVRIETGLGPVEFRESGILRVIPGHDPEAEWPSRRDAARKGSTASRLDAAWWALENGLVDEAAAMIEAAHAADPGDREAARLAATNAALRRPIAAPETQALREALGVSCEATAGQLVFLLHQHPDSTARARLKALEAVVRAYYLMFAFHGLDLPPPRAQLVSVYLRERASYLRFLETQNAAAFRSTQGYYHPTFHVVVAFDARATRWDAAARVSEDADRRRLLKALDEADRDLGIASHEMIHLLANASGLDGEPRRLPCWFHEGLAAQFEVYRAGRWAGIGRAHDLRLPDWRALPSPPSLAALVRDEAFGHGYEKGLYAESWALVWFLRKSKPTALLAFVDLLRNPDGTSFDSDADRFLARFRAAFGDGLNRLETDWLQSMAGCQTPLEQFAPTGAAAAR